MVVENVDCEFVMVTLVAPVYRFDRVFVFLIEVEFFYRLFFLL
jgi:hypothetical protein